MKTLVSLPLRQNLFTPGPSISRKLGRRLVHSGSLLLLLLAAALLPQGATATSLGDTTITSINCESGLNQGYVEVTDVSEQMSTSYVAIDNDGGQFGAGVVHWTPTETSYTGAVPFEFTIANLAAADYVMISTTLSDFSATSGTTAYPNCDTEIDGPPEERGRPVNAGPPAGKGAPCDRLPAAAVGRAPCR